MSSRQRAVQGDEVTYVVLDSQWHVVEPVEAYLEYLRQEAYSPNTVRAYAQGLALWWSMLEDRHLDWRWVGVDDLSRFVKRLRNGWTEPSVVALRPDAPMAASTVDVALTAVLGFYRYQAIVADVPAARRFYVRVKGGTLEARSRYASFLGHVGGGRNRRVVGRRHDPKSAAPFLTPTQIATIKDDAARFDAEGVRWLGDLRLRLFWTLLEEHRAVVGYGDPHVEEQEEILAVEVVELVADVDPPVLLVLDPQPTPWVLTGLHLDERSRPGPRLPIPMA